MHVQTRIEVLILVSLLLHSNMMQSCGAGRSGGSSNNSPSGSSRSRGGGESRFLPGTGIGSVAGVENFTGVLTGGAAGYLQYRGSQAVISIAGVPIVWNSRAYYWDSLYYTKSTPRGLVMCYIALNASNPVFKDVVFENGERPKLIAWGCKDKDEDCCGLECCPQSQLPTTVMSTIWIVLGCVIIAIILMMLLLLLLRRISLIIVQRKSETAQTPNEATVGAVAFNNGQNDLHSDTQDKRETVAFLQNTSTLS